MPTAVKSVLPVVLLGCGGVGRYRLPPPTHRVLPSPPRQPSIALLLPLPTCLSDCFGDHWLADGFCCLTTCYRRQGVAIRVVGVADSSSLLVADDVNSSGLDDALLTHLCAAKSAGSPLSSLLGQGRHPPFRSTTCCGISAVVVLGTSAVPLLLSYLITACGTSLSLPRVVAPWINICIW